MQFNQTLKETDRMIILFISFNIGESFKAACQYYWTEQDHQIGCWKIVLPCLVVLASIICFILFTFRHKMMRSHPSKSPKQNNPEAYLMNVNDCLIERAEKPYVIVILVAATQSVFNLINSGN